MRSGWLRAAAGAAAATTGGLASSSIWARAAADDSGQAGSGGGNGGGAWLDPITFLKAWTGGSLASEHFPSAPAADNTISGLLPKREHTPKLCGSAATKRCAMSLSEHNVLLSRRVPQTPSSCHEIVGV